MPDEPLPTVYLETSVISYLAAGPSCDLIIAAKSTNFSSRSLLTMKFAEAIRARSRSELL
jgi:hypothetical protein